MSGIFGIFKRNGNAVSVNVSRDMHETMSYWQPDASGIWHKGPVCLGHEMLWNTPESKSETLPNDTEQLVITIDARLDNRHELAHQLDLPIRPLEQIGDSEFILAAYQKWTEDCPKYLVGDFVFAIWDKNKQQLFCARDHIGVKQFYYHTNDQLFAFSNDLESLASHTEIPSDIEDQAVANYLVNDQLEHQTLTFFRSVKKLPPAHSLTITAGEIKKKCYWRLEDAPRVELPDMESYAAKLRELLEQAVHDRMRSAYPITSHLSGGLDSSSIAVIAARKLRETGEKLLAFNWLHEPDEDDDPEHYEWSNSRSIANAEGIEHHYVPLTVDSIYEHMNERSIFFGDTSTFWCEYPVRVSAQACNSRTILSGWGGDELSTYHGQAYYADLFKQGKLFKSLIELKQIAFKQKEKKLRRFIALVYHRIFLVLIPRNLYCYMPKNRSEKQCRPPFINKFIRPFIDVELGKLPILTIQPNRTIREHMLAYIGNGHIQARIESWATSSIINRLEYSYPLLDKRIVEFVLGLPAELFVSQGKGRYLFRSAISDLLPKDIIWGDFKIERKRIHRCVYLENSAWKSIKHNPEHIHLKSKYLNIDSLFQAIEDINEITLESEFIDLIQYIDSAISLLKSENLYLFDENTKYH